MADAMCNKHEDRVAVLDYDGFLLCSACAGEMIQSFHFSYKRVEDLLDEEKEKTEHYERELKTIRHVAQRLENDGATNPGRNAIYLRLLADDALKKFQVKE